MQEFLNKKIISGDKIRHLRIMLVKANPVEYLDTCEGCIFYNKEEKIDCSLIGSPMSCVIDMHYSYVWKNVGGEETK